MRILTPDCIRRLSKRSRVFQNSFPAKSASKMGKVCGGGLMIQIERISRLTDVGIFRDFSWPAELPDFGRYNLIYGWNGTGKTTLSRIFRALELRHPLTSGEAVIRINGRDISSHDFKKVALNIRVFNRDFVNESVFPHGGGDLPPIFVLGKKSVEKQKEVNRLRNEYKQKQKKLNEAIKKKQRAETELDKFCIKNARIIKDMLRSSGSNPYNNYNKSHFRRDIEEIVNIEDVTKYILSDQDRNRLFVLHRASAKPKLKQVVYEIPDLEKIIKEVSCLLSTTVVSQVIEKLKKDQELSEWIRKGLTLHRERYSEICLFCEQPISTTRLSELEAHFTDEYEKFLASLNNKITELQSFLEQLNKVTLPHKTEFYEDLADEYENARQKLTTALERIEEFLRRVVDALKDKKGRVFERVELDIQIPIIDQGVVDAVNTVIDKHNLACDELESRVRDARDRIARDMIARSLEDFINLKQNLEEENAAVETLEEELKRLKAEIDQLEREIVEHRRPAEELNEDLRKYLGHDELKLEIRDTGYAITRNGQPAYALSEGEMTAIALLYFLKSLKDRSFDLKNGVIVLDDPVSSLDANALYLAFGFIRERTKDAGQLFIFTHNFTFFRQVRNWFHHLKGQRKKDISKRPARFYMLDCSLYVDGRAASLCLLDPLLEQYESDYHYLFSRLYREAQSSSESALEISYTLPNMARRLLEAFLAFRQPQVSGELWQKMKDIDFDEAKKLRILRFVHTYSHSDSIGEPGHDPSLLAEARSVLKDLMEFIETLDPQHYSAMKELAKRCESEEGE